MALLRSPSSVTVTDLVLLPDRSKDAEGRCREDRRHPRGSLQRPPKFDTHSRADPSRRTD